MPYYSINIIRIACFIILFIPFSNLVHSQELEEFLKLSNEMGFTFQLPNGYDYMPLVEQEDALYYIGFKNPSIDEEFRVAAYPMTWFENFPPLTKKTELKNRLAFFTYMLGLNISQNEDLEFKVAFFDDNDVWNEFGGNIGITFAVRGGSDFSKGYKYVLINCIYREGRGMLVLYVLLDDVLNYVKRIKSPKSLKAFYCVKFK